MLNDFAHSNEEPTAIRAATVVVPTFREAANMPELVERVEKVRQETGLDLDLLIVDDNSRDGTADFVASCGRPWVRLIVRTEERGLSSAVLHGVRKAAHNVLVVMDADLSHPPEAIPEMLRRLDGGAEFVIGSRFSGGGSTDASWAFSRRANSGFATLLARPFTSAADPMSGFLAFRKSLLERAEPVSPLGYKIGLELIVRSRTRRVEEVPIHFADRSKGSSKLTVGVRWEYLRHLFRLAMFKIGSREPRRE